MGIGIFKIWRLGKNRKDNIFMKNISRVDVNQYC